MSPKRILTLFAQVYWIFFLEILENKSLFQILG